MRESFKRWQAYHPFTGGPKYVRPRALTRIPGEGCCRQRPCADKSPTRPIGPEAAARTPACFRSCSGLLAAADVAVDPALPASLFFCFFAFLDGEGVKHLR